MAKDDKKKKGKKSKDEDVKKSKSKDKSKAKKGKGGKKSKSKGSSRLGGKWDEFVIENARLSHPHIFKRSNYEGKDGKFEATFLIPKKTDLGKKIKKMIDGFMDDAVDASKVKKVSKDNKCLRDGDKSDKPEYKGHWTIKASRDKRPATLDADGDSVTADDEVIYAGCYVDAVLGLWVQNNTYGKKVNCNLYGVQFAADGEPFSAGMSSDEASDILKGKKGKGDGGKY